MEFSQKILHTIQENNLFDFSNKLLVACSGGVDSMVLVHVLQELNFTLSIVHVDHHTRNGESAKDSSFVESYCAQNNIPFYKKTLLPINHTENNSVSFQTYAREQRYLYFNELCNEYGYEKILLAHHADDAIETFMINLSRGTGIKGLLGIPIQRDKIVRPLINVRKAEIIDFSLKRNLLFRQDESNFESNYKRNYVRNIILPELQQWHPGIDNSILKTIQNLKDTEYFNLSALEEWKTKIIKKQNDIIIVKLNLLQGNKNADFILFNILDDFQFNRNQINEMLSSDVPGKTWNSETYIAYLERNNKLHIRKQDPVDYNANYEFNKVINGVGRFILSKESKTETLVDFIQIDRKIDPKKLVIRHWNDGDYLQTQVGKKKLKKIFQELQVSNFEKHSLVLLAYKSEIFWIVGKKKAFIKTPGEYCVYLISE